MLLTFSEKLRKAKDKSTDSDYLSLNLSSRQLLRACRRLNAFPEQSLQDLRPLLHDTLLTQFLPSSCARLVDSILDDCSAPSSRVSAANTTYQKPADTIREQDGRLFIGDVSHPIQKPTNPELVPQPHYFDIPKHTRTMKAMLQDVVAGQKHMLLIGNQGVGKNKLADRLLQLLQQEREYIQLHRDVSSITFTIRYGCIYIISIEMYGLTLLLFFVDDGANADARAVAHRRPDRVGGLASGARCEDWPHAAG